MIRLILPDAKGLDAKTCRGVIHQVAHPSDVIEAMVPRPRKCGAAGSPHSTSLARTRSAMGKSAYAALGWARCMLFTRIVYLLFLQPQRLHQRGEQFLFVLHARGIVGHAQR